MRQLSATRIAAVWAEQRIVIIRIREHTAAAEAGGRNGFISASSDLSAQVLGAMLNPDRRISKVVSE